MAGRGEKTVVDSKLIEYMVYDKAESTLEVQYKRGYHNGQLKKYKNIESGAFDYIIGHESPGKALKSVLRKIDKEFERKSFFHKLLSRLPFF